VAGWADGGGGRDDESEAVMAPPHRTTGGGGWARVEHDVDELAQHGARRRGNALRRRENVS
jgi:hypothetical protein